MAKFVVKDKFATVPNALLNNSSLTLRAKGLYAYIQSKPDGWDFSAERSALDSKDGRDSVREGLKELEQAGYLTRTKTKNLKGFFEMEYELLLQPSDGISSDGISDVGLSNVGEAVLYSNKEIVKKNSNKEVLELDKSNSSCDPVFSEEIMPGNKDQSNGTKGKKKTASASSADYLAMVDFWLKDFHPDFTFGAMHGRNLKEIEKKINFLLDKAERYRVNGDVLAFFKAVCENLPDWFQNKDLQVINSKFNEIIKQIKDKNNGKPVSTNAKPVSKYRN